MGTYVQNFTTFRSEKNKQELIELAKFLLSKQSIFEIDELFIDYYYKDGKINGYCQVFNPAMNDFYTAINKVNMIEIKYETKWFPLNRLFKLTCHTFTGITIYNTYYGPEIPEENEYWDYDLIKDYSYSDFEAYNDECIVDDD